jgi:CubicO group peptidase (beta-lactamase class C family)
MKNINFNGWPFVVISIFLFSSCTIGRMAVYQLSDIKDYKRFPSRPLAASSDPFRFYPGDPEAFQASKVKITADEETLPFDQFLPAHKTVAFLIIRRDSILYEQYFDGYTESDWVASFSMAKSYVSALVGIAVEEGFIKSVQDPITDYIPELKKNGLEDVTVRHVLQMTTGIHHAENYFNPFAGVAKSYYGKHLRKQVLRLKQDYEAGIRWHYQSINTQVLGEILVQATGRTLTDYMQEKLWTPMAMEYPATWSIDQKKNGMEKAFCGINATARDFAKFGRLYLREGDWDGKQVVPREWVIESTKVDEEEGAWSGYQYQWWLPSKEGDYTAEGHLGQFIYVNPDKELVMVRLGKNYGKVSWPKIFRGIAAQL